MLARILARSCWTALPPIALALLAPIAASAVNHEGTLLPGWVVYEKRQPDDADRRCANYSNRWWEVTTNGGSLAVRERELSTRTKDPIPSGLVLEGVGQLHGAGRRIIQMDTGWLLGIDAGENGGSLLWCQQDGKCKQLSEDNVVGFWRPPSFSSKEAIVLVGLDHLGSAYGRVLRATRVGRDIELQQLVDLKATPMAFSPERKGTLLIVTEASILRLIPNRWRAEVVRPVNFALLYPNSIALTDEGSAYVGMLHFVARIPVEDARDAEQWFVPHDCTIFTPVETECVCRH